MDIFLVDDDPVVRNILSILVRAEGHEVKEFADGKAFMNYLRNVRDSDKCKMPKLVFLDLLLSDISGLEIMDQLEKEGLRKFKIALISSNSEQETRSMTPKLKSDFYLEKPFQTKEISEIIKQL